MTTPRFDAPLIDAFGLSNVGNYSSPAFTDIDNDGDLDVFVGNNDGDTLFFLNSGDAANPQFDAPQTNSFGLSFVGSLSIPTFADIDDDGDLDAFIGTTEGDTYFFLNSGDATNPQFDTPQANPFGLSKVTGYSSPTFADTDDDGDLDAFIGSDTGDTYFFLNSGNASNPQFDAAQINPFGLSNVGGYSSPVFVDVDSDSDLDAFIGNKDGNTLFFLNSGDATIPQFDTPQTNPFGFTNVVSASTPTFADINSDGLPDAFVGAVDGNLRFYLNTTGQVSANPYLVTNTNDSGVGSLRWAIGNANIAGGSQTISFDASLKGQTVTLTNGELVISGSTTIDGDLDNNGQGDITVERDASAAEFRIFYITDGIDTTVQEVTIDGLTITGGVVGGVDSGGGIYNLENLTVRNSTITGNTAILGGGIYSYRNQSSNIGGQLTITNSTISNNNAQFGGGIYSTGVNTSIANSTISDNTAVQDGGGVYNNGDAMTITNSTISGNSSQLSNGGGIYNTGANTSIANSTISDNRASVVGGGVYNNGDAMTITNSTISGNTATTGGGLFNGDTITIKDSTISNTISGSGISNTGVATITNSTISGNSSAVQGGGFYNTGVATIEDSTISGNSSRFGGGGLFNQNQVTITNSSFSNNTAGTYGNAIFNDNTVRLDAATATSIGVNANVTSFGGLVVITGTRLADTLEGSNGNDQISGLAANDSLSGFSGNDSLNGGLGNDTLFGGDGNDSLNGREGNDTLDGGKGNDRYLVGTGTATLVELAGEGVDTVVTYNQNWTLGNNLENLELKGTVANGTGNALNNRITGNDANNRLSGLIGADYLLGLAGNDELLGGLGNDRLLGGAGDDRLLGGGGDDQFIFASGAAFDKADFGIDRITDFAGSDRIVLSLSSFSSLGSSAGTGFTVASEFEVVTSDSQIGRSAALIVYNSSNGKLVYNQNGSQAGLGSGSQFAVLTTTPALTANSFQLQ